MIELLLPRTDSGVLVQAVAVAALFLAALVLVRRNHELTLLMAGLATMTLAWFGVRALH